MIEYVLVRKDKLVESIRGSFIESDCIPYDCITQMDNHFANEWDDLNPIPATPLIEAANDMEYWLNDFDSEREEPHTPALTAIARYEQALSKIPMEE